MVENGFLQQESHDEQLRQINSSTYSVGEDVVRIALLASVLSGRAISIVDIRSDNGIETGLSESMVLFINAMASCTDAELKGVGKGSQAITFAPQKPFSPPRKFVLELDKTYSLSLMLLPFAIAGLYSPKRVSLEFVGVTHGQNFLSVDALKEYLLRPLMPYAYECVLSINKVSFYPDIDGRVMLTVNGKHELDTNCPHFSLIPANDLVAIRAKLVASKALSNSNTLERVEQLLRLAFREKHVPLVVDVTYVDSTEPACAISLNALFGNNDGYDNDKPWIQQAACCFSQDDVDNGFDDKIYELIREFESKMPSQKVDPVLAEHILPLIALQGGMMTVEHTTDRLNDYAHVLETVLGVPVTIRSDGLVQSTGFAKQMEPRIKGIDEL